MSTDSGVPPRASRIGDDQPHITTGGAMARRRTRRLAVLSLLACVLLVLLYVAYYYSQNHALPVPRIVQSDQTVDPPQYLYSFSGVGSFAMTKPTGIGVIGDRVYVTDLGARNVRAYDRSGNHLFDFGAIPGGAGRQLDSPVHIAIGPDSTVWVTDRSRRGVFVFDRDGNYQSTLLPNGDAKFIWSPLAIAFAPDGDVFVSDVGDSSRHQVLRMKPDGTIQSRWGKKVTDSATVAAPGAFQFPNGLAVAATTTSTVVYVADADNHRVQVFRPDGTFVKIISTSGTPRGLAVDARGQLWVVDPLAHQVDAYSADGVPLTSFGSYGRSPGQFSFPNDVVIDAAGRILVTDRDNNQVQVWGYPVAEIPGITRISARSTLNLLPWLALLAVLVSALVLVRTRRPRSFVVTRDFVDGMIEADLVPRMSGRRIRFVVTEAEHEQYVDLVRGGIDLGALVRAEPHSAADADVIRGRFAVEPALAATLALARRHRVLCTDDLTTARLAVALGIDVYDRGSWLDRWADDPSQSGDDRATRRAKRTSGRGGRR